DRDERRRPRLARETADRRAHRTEPGTGQDEPDEEQRQPLPRLAARDVRRLDRDAEDQRDRRSESERHGGRERDLRPDELAEADESPREPADHVLVPFGGERAGREEQREEADRQRERIRLHLR